MYRISCLDAFDCGSKLDRAKLVSGGVFAYSQCKPVMADMKDKDRNTPITPLVLVDSVHLSVSCEKTCPFRVVSSEM